MPSATISGLYRYPIKGCRGTALDRVTLSRTGFEHDRRWLVVTPDGQGLTQRQIPRLALVAPRVDGELLVLEAPQMPALEVSPRSDGDAREIIVQKDRCLGRDTGDAAAEWLTRFLGEPVRLARFDRDAVRNTSPALGGTIEPILFPDAFPILIISEGSLADLNGRLDTPLPMARFRPNIVLTRIEAYQEDRIARLVAGAIELSTVYPCPRCKVTTVDQETGTFAGPEPLVTLLTYRQSPEAPGVMFGRYALITRGVGHELRVGTVLTTQLRA